MIPCSEYFYSSHEEADTRITLHAESAHMDGHKRIVVSCSWLTHFTYGLSEKLWMRIGTSQDRRYIALHGIKLPPGVIRNLVAYYSLTDHDAVSQPNGHGKKTTWKVLEKYPHLLDDLGTGALTDRILKNVEDFFCLLYAPESNIDEINMIRYKMFERGTKDLEKFPPCRKSFEEHVKRALHQAKIWHQS